MTAAGAEAPAFVLGTAVIRGAPVVVLDLVALLTHGRSPVGRSPDAGEPERVVVPCQVTPPSRLVMLRAADRTLAVAVSAVVGVRRMPVNPSGLSPLIDADALADLAGLRTVDEGLVALLERGFRLTDPAWSAAGDPAGDRQA